MDYINITPRVAATVTLLVSCTTVWYCNRRSRLRLLKKCGIPGPDPNFWIGNLMEYESKPNVCFDEDMVTRYGLITGYYLGAKPVILVADPELIKEILITQKDIFCERPRRVPGGINPDPKRSWMLGNLPFTKWKEIRGIVSKFFPAAHLKQVAPSVEELVVVMIDKIEQSLATEGNSAEIDLYGLFQGLTLDIIAHTGFGIQSNIQKQPNDPFLKAVQGEFSKKTSSTLVKFYLCAPEIAWLLFPLRRMLQFLKEQRNMCPSLPLWQQGFDVLEERRFDLQNMTLPKKDLLGCLIQATPKLSDIQIVANSVLFLEAGYETTSSILGVLINLLALNKDAQTNIRQELKAVNYNPDDNLSYLKTCGGETLPYMTAAIFEALRMYPPQTTFLGRYAVRDYIYKNSEGREFTIPKGCHVQVALYQIHNMPMFWESPTQFRPERFMNDGEGIQNMKRCCWLAFGGGARSCIGQRFAMNNLKLILANILSRYSLEICDKTEKDIFLAMDYKIATMCPKSSYVKVVRMPLENSDSPE